LNRLFGLSHVRIIAQGEHDIADEQRDTVHEYYRGISEMALDRLANAAGRFERAPRRGTRLLMGRDAPDHFRIARFRGGYEEHLSRAEGLRQFFRIVTFAAADTAEHQD
jgi:hypothetical protein